MNLRDVMMMGRELMTIHGLPTQGWTFKFDSARVRHGRTNYETRTISVSRRLALVNSAEHIRNTILHEIAHALTGTGAGHGPQWRNNALSIGCDGERCASESGIVRISRPWQGICERHGELKGLLRFTRRKNLTHTGCGGTISWKAVQP